MADGGYSDGSVIVNTDLDPSGFEKGTDKMKDAVDSATDSFSRMGEKLKDATDGMAGATRDAAPIIQQAMQDSARAFDDAGQRAQDYIDKFATSMPEKQFNSGLNAVSKSVDSVTDKMSALQQAYSNAADGGEKEIAKFESTAAKVESGLDKLGAKIEELYGSSVRSKDGLITDGKDNEDLQALITKYDDLIEQYSRMVTEIDKVKAETQAAKAAEIAAAEKARAETEAAMASNKRLADSNTTAWQSIKQEIKNAESDTRSFETTASSIGKSLDTLDSKIFSLGPSAKKAMGGSESAIDSFEFKVANTQRTIDTLRARLETLGSTQVTTEAYDEINRELEQARARLDSYLKEQQKMLNSGVSKESTDWEIISQKIEAAKSDITDYEIEKYKLESNGGAMISGTDTTAYQEMQQQITAAENSLVDYENKVEKANNKTHILSATLKGIGKVGVGSFKLLGKTIAAVTNKIRSFSKSSNGSVAAVKKLTKVFTSFGSRIKSMLKRRFISSIISGATEGIKNLAQVSPEVNAAMSSMKSALSQLKNSFGTAFAPIITTVAPLLTTLINLLSEAFTKLGMFISALTGATSFKKAAAVQEDYAQSLNDTSKAADKANKSVAGFDELNNTTSSDSTDSSSGTNVADMFEDVPIDSKVADFAKKIKDAFLSGDFEGIGEILADKVNGIFRKINNAVDWNNVGPKITKVVNGITSLFNSLVDNIDWALIGDTFAKGVNTVVNTIYLLATGINWANLGKQLMTGLNSFIYGVDWTKFGKTIGTLFQSALSFINAIVHNFDFVALAKAFGDTINGAFSAINWAMLGDTISTGIKNAFAFVKTAAQTIDFKQIGADVAEALNNIDWPGIFTELASMLSSLLSGALNLLIGFAQNLDWSKLGNDIWNSLVGIVTSIDWTGLLEKAATLAGSAVAGATQLIAAFFTNLWEAIKTGYAAVKDYFGEKVKEAGGNLWQGVLDGICEGLYTIGTWIYDHIFKPFIDGFKSVFGIHSPSTVMMEMGNFLIEGLKNGISATWAGIKSFFVNAWNGIKNICTTAWNGIKSGCKAAWDKVTGTIKDACTSIKNGVTEKFTAVKDFISDKVTNIKNKVSEGFTAAKNFVTDKVTGIKNKVSEGFSNAWSTVSNKVSSIKSTISTGFSNVYSTVSSKISSIKSNISSGFSSMTTTVSNAASNIFSSVSGKFTSLVSSAWSWGSDICSNIANGISSMAGTVWDSVSSLASDIADFLGFSEPERGPLSNFHTYMPDMLQLMADGINKNKGIALDAVSNLAGQISDEAQNTSVLVPIDAENKYTRFLETFSDKITDAFMDLISRLEAIAGNVTFATPAVAEGTVIPYNLKMADYEHGDREEKTVDLTPITSRIDRVVDKLDEVVDAIDNKETGITDEAVYNSVKQSARKETKSTGRNPFTG